MFNNFINFIKCGETFDRFEDTISFKVDHTFIESKILNLVSCFSCNEIVSNLISIFHHFKDSDSSLITCPITSRTFIAIRTDTTTLHNDTVCNIFFSLFWCNPSTHDLLFEEIRIQATECFDRI